MDNRSKRRNAFHPSLTEAKLEERLVLNAGVSAVTPPPAPPPVYSNILVGHAVAGQTVRALRVNYAHEARVEALLLRNVVGREITQFYASHPSPTAQQLSNLSASVQGTVDSAALGLTSQAALLPASSTRLVPEIQSTLVGTAANSLSSRLNTILSSTRYTASATQLVTGISQQIAMLPNTLTSELNNFFNTTNVSRLAVNSSGQQIPLSQYMADQVISELGDSLGTLSQTFPTVANAMLFPNGVTTAPSQQTLAAFDQQAANALATAAMQIGSSLSLFSGSGNVISQISPLLFGSTTNPTSLASVLQSLPFGSANFTSAVSNAFNTAFDDLINPIDSFLGLPVTTNVPLPTTGLTSPFSSQVSTSSLASGFNNGLPSVTTTTGFVGFVGPTLTNSNFYDGFNNMAQVENEILGYQNTVGGMPLS